jgi:hypothetical protein
LKKLVVIILSLVYLSATVGITLQQHYCMNRFVGWSLMDTDGDLCGSCGMDKSEPENGCCKDEQLQLKIGDDQQPSFITIQFHQQELPVLSGTWLYHQPATIPAGNKYVVDHGPPHPAAIPVFLLNRVFRI